MKPLLANPFEKYEFPERLTPNRYYANVIHHSFCGQQASELTCVKQYLYHFFMNMDSEFAEGLQSIYLAEMIHLDALGRLITLYGSEPRYYVYSASIFQQANSVKVYYGNDIRDMFYDDMKCEERALEAYLVAAKIIQDKPVLRILEQLAADEQAHLNWFREACANL